MNAGEVERLSKRQIIMKTSMGSSDTTLRNEELKGFAQLYSAALMRYFRKRGCQKATVDDLVQDVFARLAGRGAATKIKNPEAYLMQTASSVWKDFLRKRQTHSYVDHVEYEDRTHAVQDVSPENIYQGKENIHLLLAVLNKLPTRTRQVFILCRIEGMKHKHVARRLGISVSTVEKHMVKAIAYLTRCFGNEL